MLKIGSKYGLARSVHIFYDDETRLIVSNDDQVRLEEPIGVKTQEAILNGHLVLIRKKRSASESGAEQITKQITENAETE